ncbi:flagellin, partial [Methylobacterium trifolii]
ANARLFGTVTGNVAAASSGNSSVRSNLVKQFNDLRDQIDSLAKDSGFNGTNLLAGDKLSITFNEKTGSAQNKLDVQGNILSSANLGIGKFVDGSATGGDFNVQNDADLTKAADALTNSLTSLSSTSSGLGSNLSVVQTRQDFTKQLANVLTTGADNLTNADLNSEAANYTALQTRQSIAQQTLGLANQANQGVLQLLR